MPTVFIPRLNEIGLPTVLRGYFQNYSYVEPTLGFMRHSLKWQMADLFNKRRHLVRNDSSSHRIISVHWRGGDYRLAENRTLLGLVSLDALFSFTLKVVDAIEKTGATVSVLCYSDEPEVFFDAPFNWLPGRELSHSFDTTTSVAEFCAMLCSDYIICGNSTYSLWASYLSPFVRTFWIPDPWSHHANINPRLFLGQTGRLYPSFLQ